MKLQHIVLILLVIAAPSMAQQEDFSIIFTNVNVFDGVNEELIENANVLVVGALVFVAASFPADWWKILLVGVAWMVFSHSLSLNSVTLAWIERVLPGDLEIEDRVRVRDEWLSWYRKNRDVYRRNEPENFELDS